MKLINAELQAKELKLKQLSQELQDDIAQHKEMIVKYNMACDEYDNDEEEDKGCYQACSFLDITQ